MCYSIDVCHAPVRPRPNQMGRDAPKEFDLSTIDGFTSSKIIDLIQRAQENFIPAFLLGVVELRATAQITGKQRFRIYGGASVLQHFTNYPHFLDPDTNSKAARLHLLVIPLFAMKNNQLTPIQFYEKVKNPKPNQGFSYLVSYSTGENSKANPTMNVFLDSINDILFSDIDEDAKITYQNKSAVRCSQGIVSDIKELPFTSFVRRENLIKVWKACSSHWTREQQEMFDVRNVEYRQAT